jgi:hypothetical protein
LACLHKDEELIFRRETLSLGAGFKGRSPISAFEEMCQSREQSSPGAEDIGSEMGYSEHCFASFL